MTCAKWLPYTRKLAISSFARSMKIYDLQTFEQCGQVGRFDAESEGVCAAAARCRCGHRSVCAGCKASQQGRPYVQQCQRLKERASPLRLPSRHRPTPASPSSPLLAPPHFASRFASQIPEIDYAPMAMDVWVAPRNRDAEMVVFGDGGGFVRLYELRINPMV